MVVNFDFAVCKLSLISIDAVTLDLVKFVLSFVVLAHVSILSHHVFCGGACSRGDCCSVRVELCVDLDAGAQRLNEFFN